MCSMYVHCTLYICTYIHKVGGQVGPWLARASCPRAAPGDVQVRWRRWWWWCCTTKLSPFCSARCSAILLSAAPAAVAATCLTCLTHILRCALPPGFYPPYLLTLPYPGPALRYSTLYPTLLCILTLRYFTLIILLYSTLLSSILSCYYLPTYLYRHCHSYLYTLATATRTASTPSSCPAARIKVPTPPTTAHPSSALSTAPHHRRVNTHHLFDHHGKPLSTHLRLALAPVLVRPILASAAHLMCCP